MTIKLNLVNTSRTRHIKLKNSEHNTVLYIRYSHLYGTCYISYTYDIKTQIILFCR